MGQNFGNAVGLNGRFLSMGTLEENRYVYSSEKNIRAGFEDSKGHTVEMTVFKEGDVLKHIVQLSFQEPYWDDEPCTKKDTVYAYPVKQEEPNCFTEAIEREIPLRSFENNGLKQG
ncbi:hypothetical protein AALB52_00300 [Lachnospiraceae bacterium 38-14]